MPEANATHDTYRAANQLRMAARRALEWIGMFKGPFVLSDMNYQLVSETHLLSYKDLNKMVRPCCYIKPTALHVMI